MLSQKTATSRFDYAIFDADGTLWDSMGVYALIFSLILNERFGCPKKESKAFYKATAGTALDRQFRECLADDGVVAKDVEIVELVDEFFKRLAEFEPLPLFPGVINVLYALSRNGYILFLSSGTRDATLQKRLRKIGKKYFQEVLGSSTIPKGKRHLERFAASTHRRLFDFTRKAVFISDGPSDMTLARQNGIFAVGLTTTVSANSLMQSGACEIIESIDRLPIVLELK